METPNFVSSKAADPHSAIVAIHIIQVKSQWWQIASQHGAPQGYKLVYNPI